MTIENVSSDDLNAKILAIEHLSDTAQIASFSSVKSSVDAAMEVWNKLLDKFLALGNRQLPWGKNDWAPNLLESKNRLYDTATKVLLHIIQSGSSVDQLEAKNLLKIYQRSHLISEEFRDQVASLLDQK